MSFSITIATENDVPLILELIRELAAYEKLSAEVTATEQQLRRTLFGERAYAEVLIARDAGLALGFALFFHNYSTFLGQPGIYLEDLYVREQARGRGIGSSLLAQVARLAVERDCGRVEWWVLDWNRPAIRLYEKLGAVAMDDWTVFRLDRAALERLASPERG